MHHRAAVLRACRVNGLISSPARPLRLQSVVRSDSLWSRPADRRASSASPKRPVPNGRLAGRSPPPPPPPPSAAYLRQRRREWVIVGVAGSAAAFGGWYYWVNIRAKTDGAQKRQFSMGSRTNATSFSIPARHPASGQATRMVITPLSTAEVDERLRQNERSTQVDRPSGACLVARYDTNIVASNDPVEDKRAEVIVERDRGVGESSQRNAGAGRRRETAAPQAEEPVRGDLCFFTVMDGHAGHYTSTLLSQKLIAFVALELDKVFRETGEYAQMGRSRMSLRSAVWRSLFGGRDRTADGVRLALAALDGDPEIVKRAIVKGFRGLDKEIVNTPQELLKQYELSLAANATKMDSGDKPANSLSSLASSVWPTVIDTSSSSPFFTGSRSSAYESLLPALSGSCALMVYIDSARRDVYVANTGDSRAVAGYWDERNDRWEVEALTVDQTGRNPDEVKRIQREHPADEASTVIQRGRVLGGLEPTRAFGDARYKWDSGTQGRIYDAFLPRGSTAARPPPRGLKTPPYVTAEPVVGWRRVHLASPREGSDAATSAPESLVAAAEGLASSLGATAPTRELRFIIMATDGLWDLMSNQEAVGLVAGHLAGIRGTITAAELEQRCFQPAKAVASARRVDADGGGTPGAGAPPADGEQPPAKAVSQQGSHHPLYKAPNHQQTFVFEDDNLGTHLVRNALGGAARERVAGLLAIPPPQSRRYRDDITVNVILFHTSASQRSAPTGPQPEAPRDDPRAKL
ncbi:[pyruvate dehydrogenase (acetyl-transferring)]-phosphatase [Malassezia sp. CBS 17886]|nr:[pyruvate dehydrogenase (acetyl-transferring)]-phosphatase [Malassezia sp. CBS 17886]